MPELLMLVVSMAVSGTVVSGVANKAQGNDVLNSMWGGFASGIAGAIIAWLMAPYLGVT